MSDFNNVNFDNIFEQISKTEGKKRNHWRLWFNWSRYQRMIKRTLIEFAKGVSGELSSSQPNWTGPFQDKSVSRWGYLVSFKDDKIIGVKVQGDHLKVGYVTTRSLADSKSPQMEGQKASQAGVSTADFMAAFEEVYGKYPGYNDLPSSVQVFNIVERCSFSKIELRAALGKVWQKLKKQ